MHWENYDPEFRKKISATLGGTTAVDTLIGSLNPEPDTHILDLCPGPGAVPAVVALELQANMTVIVGDPESEAEVENTVIQLDVAERVRVIPGSAAALPVPSEEFNHIFCMGKPFLPSPTSGMIKEMYRILAPAGSIGFTGAMSLRNDAPYYIEPALKDLDIRLWTPAYTALMFAREGFHIVTAEYLGDVWDHWTKWLENAPSSYIPDNLRKAIVEDDGRWLSLGLIVLRKPPRPAWAM